MIGWVGEAHVAQTACPVDKTTRLTYGRLPSEALEALPGVLI